MSNVISIDELRKEFLAKSKPKDLKEFVEKQQELLEKFMRENETLSLTFELTCTLRQGGNWPEWNEANCRPAAKCQVERMVRPDL